MANQYPSSSIEKYPQKTAFLIDCAQGLNGFALNPQTIDAFPPNCDIFLFYPNNESRMNRHLKRFESVNHGVFLFPTSKRGTVFNLAFILGQIQSKYDDLIVIASYHAAYEDLCEQLLINQPHLRNHIQVRSFERSNEFEQFLREMARLQNENETKKSKDNQKTVLNYSPEHLFHACPFESRQESANLYRFGEFLHHLDTEHVKLQYEYCAECQQTLKNPTEEEQQSFEEHLRDKHWKVNGFHITIRHV